MVRDIVVYPDKRLKIVSEDVEFFDSELHTLLDDMYETMVAKNGVGLAAVQIAVHQRVLIINVPIETMDEQMDQPKDNTIEMINPVIIATKDSDFHQEGCLSVPGFYEDIERHKWVKVEYKDRYGKSITIEDGDFLAVAIQHEMDHLDGKLFVEKLSYIKRKKFEKEWKKRIKEGK
jgi:peptide deformylase